MIRKPIVATVAAAAVLLTASPAMARPVPDPHVYCGPGYYPPAQYGGRCVRIKHLALGKPSIFEPWTWF